MALSEKRRSQLDGIVSQMESNGETTEDIQFVVNDFKNKYGDEGEFEVETPPEPVSRETPESQQEPGFFDKNVMQPAYGFADRLQKRSDAVYAPTVIGDALGTKPGTVADAIAGTPERATRLVLGGVGSVADAAGVPVSVGMNIANAATGGRAGKAISSVAEKTGIGEFIGNVANKYKNWKGKQSPAAQANITASEAGIEALGVRGAIGAPGTAVKATKGTGKALEGAGKSIIARDAKIRDSIAKLAGKNPLKGVQKITDDISKYNVESVRGGFKGIAAKAQKRINAEMDRAEDAIASFSKKNPTATVDVDKTILELADDLTKGKEKSIFLNEDKAADIALSIGEALNRRKLDGLQPVSKLPEIKRTIDEGMGLFKKGSKAIELDPLPSKVGELTYLRLNNELREFVPEVLKANKAVHDLITVKEAMEQAQKLAGNRNMLGITDLALIFGGPQVAQALGAPGGAMLAGAPGAVLAGKKIVGDARGASAMIKAGNILQGKKNTIGEIAKRRRNILGNQRGSVGDAALSSNEISKIASASDNMGYNLSLKEKAEIMSPVINDLKKKNIKYIDAYHVASGDVSSIKKRGIIGSEVDYIGGKSGNLRERSTYLFLDPDDIKKGQEFLKTSKDELPVVHIRIPVDEISKLNWDSNFNLTAGTYSAERFLGSVPKGWIVDDIRGSSALKTMAATGAVAGAGLTGITIGQTALNRKKKR
jgi:hypothetical protein